MQVLNTFNRKICKRNLKKDPELILIEVIILGPNTFNKRIMQKKFQNGLGIFFNVECYKKSMNM